MFWVILRCTLLEDPVLLSQGDMDGDSTLGAPHYLPFTPQPHALVVAKGGRNKSKELAVKRQWGRHLPTVGCTCTMHVGSLGPTPMRHEHESHG
jgi:hypothetical protein